MSKFKIAKSHSNRSGTRTTSVAPSLDMTPMVDLAFLLVTFFMLTAKFRNMEPIEADPPSSTSLTQLPEKVMLITIDTAGRAYYDISGRGVREKLINRMMVRYPGLKMSQDQMDNFAKMGTFGQPIELLPQYISGDDDLKAALDEAGKGIPCDSTNNQLGDWIQEGYYAFVDDATEQGVTKEQLKLEGLRYAIKADANTDYSKVEKVIDVFRDKQIFQFNMVTNLEGSDSNADASLTAQ
jgi:biopolymer transport protein ExbD